ncbi:hypothetical protein SAY86_019760 [Trapa natans]|uniref:ubiquitinyl hydrolase 1 n=1 Tax=Trapa natans TaxID=22666 RepID=A0AAN7LLH0_TRANT|nr:hypothetical protein SAY86_019760 [Trapa natans]
MLLVLDLGLSAAVILFACAVFPLIGLVLRSKWQRSAAREEEIRRLMILASEETARAELETTASYGYSYANALADGYGAIPAVLNNHCALCFSPTTTRCAKCKAVRYCSGKCQIIHWRQGHKDECCPPSINSDFTSKLSKQKRHFSCDINLKDESRPRSNSSLLDGEIETAGPSKVKNTNFSDRPNSGNSSGSSDTGFTGFSSVPVSNESSDDASLYEGISSIDSGKSAGHLSDDAAHNMSRIQGKTVSPKSSNLAGPVQLSHHDPACLADKAHGKVTVQSHLSNGIVPDDLIAEPSTNKSNFCEGMSGPSETTCSPHHVSSLMNPIGNKDINLSDPSLNYSDASSRSNTRGQAFLHNSIPTNKSNCETGLKRVVSYDASCLSFLKAERTTNMMSGRTSNALRSLKSESSIRLRANIPSGSTEVGLSSESIHNSSAGSCRSGRQSDSTMRSWKADDVNTAVEAAYSEVAGPSTNDRNTTKTSIEKCVDKLKQSILHRQYSLRGGSDIAGRYSGKGLFPYELFVKLYTWKEMELHPRGLINCGNSCYVNAVLQCLAFTPPLTAYFLQGLHSKTCTKKDWCFMCEFESFILKTKEGGSPVSPFRIVSRVENIGSQLSNGREEDAHEFLRYAIDAMGSVCLMESRLTSGSSEEDTSLIGLTFGGYLQSKIRCTKCQGKSEQQERMMDLIVEIEGDVGTLEEALHQFTVPETLDGDNKYQCSRCGSYEKAKKKFTIVEAPNILTIALKRFQSGKYGNLKKFISYPEFLNLAPYLTGTSDKSPAYRLYGVIVHLDVMNSSYSGHYICYVKNPQNKWFKIDDSTVTPVDMETVLKVGAYVLLYSRCSPRASRSLRNQIVYSVPKPKLLAPTMMSKVAILNSEKSGSPVYDNLDSNLASSDGLANMGMFHMIGRVMEEDSPSDSSSLFSSNSDESSSSSDGTRESSCTTADFSEYPFSWQNSPRENFSDFDSSSSSSPMASSDRQAQGFPESRQLQMDGGAYVSFFA